MLKTNSKELKNKINNYIIENFENDYFTGDQNNLKEIKKYILQTFKNEKEDQFYKRLYKTHFETFEAWAQGLPSVGVFDYYYTNYYKIVDIVGDMLEQTEEQRNKYDNQQAAQLLTLLIYRSILKEA